MIENTEFYLEYLPINFSVIAQDKSILPPYLGSTLRGAIGHVLRNDTEACHYLYDNRRLDKKRQEVLNPYIIVPPMIGKKLFYKNDILNFDIMFLGDGAKYAKNVIDALSSQGGLRLGVRRNKFIFDKAVHKTDQRVIWQDRTFYQAAIRKIPLVYKTLDNVESVTIKFLTPLRRRRNNELLKDVDFSSIIRNITYRIESLTGRYGGWVDTEKMEHIQKLSSKIITTKKDIELVNMERYSNRTNEKMDFGGLMGSMSFHGDLSLFVPWLYAAQILHIGGNTTFGMGRIEVEFI